MKTVGQLKCLNLLKLYPNAVNEESYLKIPEFFKKRGIGFLYFQVCPFFSKFHSHWWRGKREGAKI